MLYEVITSDRNAESGHDRVADELVEHAALLLDALHHQREVLVQQAHSGGRAQPLGDRGEAADVREQHRRRDGLAAEQVGAGREPESRARCGGGRFRNNFV